MENNSGFSLLVSSKAQKELELSWEWYEDRQQGLGDRFTTAVIQQLNTIVKNPEAFSVKHKTYREAKVPVFPFVIVYKVHNRRKLIEAISIFHTSRSAETKY
jgi:plasmid stabilization system protein ParE